MKIRIYKLILKTISDMKLQQKILLPHFLLIIIAFSIFTFTYDSIVSNVLETHLKYSARKTFEQSGTFVLYKLQKVINASNVIMLDSEVNRVLAQSPDSIEIPTQLNEMQVLIQLLTSLQNREEIYNVKLYVNDAFIFSEQGHNISSMKSVQNTAWYKKLILSDINILWHAFMPDDNYVTVTNSEKKTVLVRALLDANDFSHPIGLLRIDVLESHFKDILNKASSTQNSIVYIQNSKNEIISSSDSEVKEEWKINSKSLADLSKNGLYFNVNILNGERVLLACQKISNSDWFMVSITPYIDISEANKNIRSKMLLLFILIAIAAYGIAYLISISITKRIKLLKSKMNNIQNGDFDIKVFSNSKDEIGELINNFNYMAESLSFLVKERIRIGQEAKNSELKALQSQINPHFLYNTLDLINWTAINNNIPAISETVNSLSSFYKLSLSSGSIVVPIKDEIEHVTMYIDLQNRRFDNAFDFQTEISNDVYKFSTIKIILQPIVENAIMHGILQKKDKKGVIKLVGYMEESTVNFIVQDDGIGIPEEIVKNILTLSSKNTSHGYGIKNINERIKLYYGEQYSLTYQSILGKGTIVKIKIPAQSVN